MVKGKSSASGGGGRYNNGSTATGGASGTSAYTTPPKSTDSTPGVERQSPNDGNPRTPTKRSSTRPSPPEYQASATQLEVYKDKRRAGRDCPRCLWPLILKPHADPTKHPRPACVRWVFNDCAWIGLQIQFRGKFCYVCGVEFAVGDVVWVFVREGFGVENFCLTDEDCLKKKDEQGYPVRVRKANASDAEKGCFDCHKADNTITIGQQVVAARTIDPRHAACAYKSRQDAIEHINNLADTNSEAANSAKAARSAGAKRFAKHNTPDNERVQPGEALDF
eukprot:g11952.t1